MAGAQDTMRPPRAKSEDKEKASPLASTKRKLSMAFLQVGGGDRKTNEPDYEEVGPPTHLRKVPDAPKDGQNCDLCGSAPAAVRCDRCGSQAFCLSCDDMYHRHPRRSTHARKAVDSRPPAGGGIRPPLPPKGESQGGVPPPQPPPRKNKRAGFLSSSAFSKKEQMYARPGTVTSRSTSMTNLQSAGNETNNNNNNSGGRTIMGSLKRFMGARPLPPTPLHNTCSGKNEAITALPSKASIRATTSPSLPNLSDHIDEEIRMGLPQSVLDLNTTVNSNTNSISTPVTPASAHAQYPPLQPKTLQPSPHTHSLGRKFSLQQLPQSFDDKRTSMVDPTAGGAPWEGETAKPPPRTRSHSVSDDQWAQMLAAETNTTTNTQSLGAPSGPTCPPGHVPADMSAFAGAATRRGYNSINNAGRSGGGTLGRGMVSSASVCDLNSLAQQQQQQPLHGFSNAAGSFQQLNMMGYGGGMMWGAPCDLCQAPPMFTGHPGISGMKRTASNLSMNLSSVGSDMSGYPWAPPPHIHHHMPMYPGYYPGYHPHMAPPPMGTPMGLNMSIPDSMHTFGKVPSSPAPSVRSSSHRSHKSAKSRSFNAGDASGRRSRNRKAKRSEESEESRSTSVSEDEDDIDDRESKSGHGGVSSLAWQCDHCTFINSGGARTCGMCSKTVGGSGRSSRRGSERRRSERRRDRRTDQEDNERDVSDYDNDGGVVKSNFSFNIKDSKREARNKVSGSNKSKSKKKSRRRDGSESQSESGSEGEEEEQLERHMRDLRVSSSSRRRGSDHDGGNNKDRDRERTSRKKEGSVGRFKNRGKSHSERSRTPGRQTPRRSSPADDQASRGGSSDRSLPEDARTSRTLSADPNGHPNSQEGTLVDTFVSEATVKSGKKSKSDSSEHKSKSKGSKAPSPAISVADEEPVHEQVLQAPVLDAKGNGEKSRSPSPRLEIRKSKSPALSQRTSRGEVDDPSFANTLDDIATMGTNEVADQDLSSHYLDDRPHSTDIQVIQNDDVPVVNYIRPVTPEEQAVDEPQTIVIEAPPGRRADFNNIEVKEEAVLMAPEDVGHVDNKIPAHEPLYEPSYETVGQPVEIEAPELAEGKTIINANDTDREQDNYHTATTGNTAEEMKVEEKQQEIVADEEILQEVNAKQGSPMDFRGEMARSASSGSSLGLNSLPPDRQYTPLSFSSSDAQFYSPPDSPDISLSEQLQDKPPPGFTQTVVAREEEYLVTALETMRQTFEDLKSSRETIRSSMEQLPYSEEAPVSVGEAEGDAPRERSKSAGSVTSVATSPAESVPRAPFPNGATASARAAASLTDAYESLSYQDALSSSGAGDPELSASDKAVRAAGQQAEDDAQAASSLADLLKEVERQRRSLEQPETQVNEKYLTVEEIITRRRQEAMRKQGLQLVQVLRDAEDAGYASEDVSIALTHCGDKNPLEWLRENWRHMVDTVSTLATNYGQERRVNDIGAITAGEARAALRLHKGNIWAAVTECVEQRQNKFDNIYARGRFKREAVVKALENHEGDADAAFLDLNKSQLQPFMMKIWGALKGETKQVPKTDPVALPQKEVQASPPPPLPTPAPASVPRPAQDDVLQPPTLVDASTDTGHANQAGGTWTPGRATRHQLHQLSDSASGESLEDREEEEEGEGEEEEVEEVEEVEATGNLQETQPLQFVRKEDVVVHPLKAFTHYADLSVSEYSEEPRSPAPSDCMMSPSVCSLDTKSSTRHTGSPPPRDQPPSGNPQFQDFLLSQNTSPDEALISGACSSQSPEHQANRIHKKAPKYSSTLHVSLSTQKDVYEHSTDRGSASRLQPAHDLFPELSSSEADEAADTLAPANRDNSFPHFTPAGVRPQSKSAPSSVRSSLILEECDESDEEESVSITTGRLSLSLDNASINVKSESIQTEQVVAGEHPHEEEREQLCDEVKDTTCGAEETTAVQGGGRTPEPVEEPAEAAEADPARVRDSVLLLPLDEPGMAQTRTGPVTVQKASVIVGKAIAKAMARETSARESLSRSVTPEVQEAPIATPEASEGEEEITVPGTTSDSDEEDHLRTLDTILEEEEISEMTESGRVMSRPASKNLFLPFNPTDVVQLSPVTRFLKTVTEPKTSTAPSNTSDKKGASVVGTEAGAGGGTSPPAAQTPPVPNSYYNTLHTYYNEPGASELPEAHTVKLTPNDYETMYEMKRQLDTLRDTSGATLDKINALVTEAPQPDQEDNDEEEIYYEEVTLKSENDSSDATQASRRRRRRRARGSSSTAGTSSRADVSEASIASSSPAQASPPTPTAQSPPPPPAAPFSPPPAAPSPPPPAAPPSPPPAAPSPPPSAPSPPAAPTPPPVPVPSEAASLPTPEETEELVTTVTIKRARKRSRISDNSSYSIIDSGTPTQLKEVTSSPNQHESVENTSNIQRRRRNVREDTSSTVSNTPSTSTSAFSTTTKDTSPSTSTPAISTTAKGSSLSTSTTTTSAVSAREHTKASLPESSGDSEDEDGGVKVHRVSVEDLPKIPHLLVQIEGLKARQNKKDPDYQEMRELKEQIQMMRRQLEARMEDEDGRPETPDSPKEEQQQQQQPSGADIILQDTQEKPVSREYEQLQFDRTVRRLLAEGRAGSYEKAELAAQLLTFKFGEMDSLQAAEECSSIYTAIQFLQQECELCAEKYPMRKMVSMLQCTHRCCCDCAKTYFTFQIKTKNIREVRCPFCNEPDLDANEEMNDEYLNNMDILLKNILDAETHELFQRKLRDWTLMKDPNFRWCNKCSSGFISNPRARKLICPDCGEVTCAHCRVTWEGAHEGISCEAFARWKADNDMEVAVQGVAKHLAECGITCPKCKFTYSLAKGGCMHFTCTQCKHEFCSGCSQPFRQGSKCSVGPYCARLGLHAHHPRNCLFYLRDKEPQQLQNLLKEAGVSFDTEPVGEQEQQGGARPMCQVQEQKELPDGLKDDICGRVVPTGYAGLCRNHYIDYLGLLCFKNRIDPLPLMDEGDLRFVFRREHLEVPKRRPWESDEYFRRRLSKLIKEHLPLGNLD
ncbi:E3 ubiquitin-protein ligase lubel isoform X11 [Procambarus clarkii]|uniref:E3 ubiquitin-protein ligase lubel isoform X11 n=1 Tax=Procambarus clarkii TaxID=6728 RepID=UPI003742881F